MTVEQCLHQMQEIIRLNPEDASAPLAITIESVEGSVTDDETNPLGYLAIRGFAREELRQDTHPKNPAVVFELLTDEDF